MVLYIKKYSFKMLQKINSKWYSDGLHILFVVSFFFFYYPSDSFLWSSLSSLEIDLSLHMAFRMLN